MCSCGKTETHWIAKRTTFDGQDVRFFSNNEIGYGFWGWPIAGVGRKKLSDINFNLLKEEACLYTIPELVARFNELHKMDAANKRKSKLAH